MDRRSEIKIPNALLRQYLTAAQDIFGLPRLDDAIKKTEMSPSSFINLPDTPDLGIASGQFARVIKELERLYPSIDRKLLQRIGFRSFQNVIEQQVLLLTPAHVLLRILPPRERLRIILDSLVDTLKKMQPEFEITIEDSEGDLAFLDRTCPICIDRENSFAICHLQVGFLMGLARWVLGGPITVIETHCYAKGDDHCRFEFQIPENKS